METPWETENTRPLPGEVVWFLLPLPRPLPVRDGFEYEHFGFAWPRAGSAVLRPPGKTVSLKVRQLDDTVDDGGRFAALLWLFGEVFGSPAGGPGGRPRPPPPPERLLGALTVVEAGVSLRRISGGTPRYTEGLSLSLDVAVWAVQDLQRACGLATGEPVRPLSVGQLPLVVPYAVGDVVGGIRVVDRGLFPMRETSVLNEPRGLPEEPVPEGLVEAAHRLTHSGLFSPYLVLAEEARWLVLLEGEPRLGVIAAASAAEAFADAVLASMLVEERADPSVAATTMRRPFGKRLSAEYSGRLAGGSWDSGLPGSNTYLLRRDVLRVRNRTVHAAERPVSYQAERALDALERFAVRLCGLVAALHDKYPRTVWLLHASGLLDGEPPAEVQDLREAEADIDWEGIVGRFRTTVARLAFDPDAVPGREPDRVAVVAVVGTDGTAALWAHDEEAGYAARLDGDPPAELRDELDALGPPAVAATVDTALGTPDTTGLEWEPDHEVLPGWETTLPTAA